MMPPVRCQPSRHQRQRSIVCRRADYELILYKRVEDVYGPGNISGSIDPLV